MDEKELGTYLGDQVYASFDGWQVTLVTFDGYRITNVIALEDNVMLALIEYAKNHFPKGLIK